MRLRTTRRLTLCSVENMEGRCEWRRVSTGDGLQWVEIITRIFAFTGGRSGGAKFGRFGVR